MICTAEGWVYGVGRVRGLKSKWEGEGRIKEEEEKTICMHRNPNNFHHKKIHNIHLTCNAI